MSEDDAGENRRELSDSELESVIAGGAMVMFGAIRPGVHVVLDGRPVTAAAD